MEQNVESSRRANPRDNGQENYMATRVMIYRDDIGDA